MQFPGGVSHMLQIDHEHPLSLSSKVFVKLEYDILSGKYKPGESLKEAKLSSEFGVSRTPVREAIRKLELEGLVEYVPNRGAIVKGISDQDVKDIYTIRMLIEGLAARWATERITRDELNRLEEILQLEELYTKKNDLGQLIRCDNSFHETIFQASKSIPLMNTLSSFHHFVMKARAVSFSTPGRAAEVLKEHRAIMEAIMAGDADKAETLTTEHVSNAKINLIKRLKNNF